MLAAFFDSAFQWSSTHSCFIWIPIALSLVQWLVHCLSILKEPTGIVSPWKHGSSLITLPLNYLTSLGAWTTLVFWHEDKRRSVCNEAAGVTAALIVISETRRDLQQDTMNKILSQPCYTTFFSQHFKQNGRKPNSVQDKNATFSCCLYSLQLFFASLSPLRVIITGLQLVCLASISSPVIYYFWKKNCTTAINRCRIYILFYMLLRMGDTNLSLIGRGFFLHGCL